jgi:hypothetical protein
VLATGVLGAGELGASALAAGALAAGAPDEAALVEGVAAGAVDVKTPRVGAAAAVGADGGFDALSSAKRSVETAVEAIKAIKSAFMAKIL